MAFGVLISGAYRQPVSRWASCSIVILAAGLLFASPLDDMALTGRAVELGLPPSERLNPPMELAPGAPPLLSFRYFDASDRGRFGNLGLMTDDAGH
jgi:hypothetical protein